MGKVTAHPSAVPPAPAVMAILSRYDRKQLQAFVEIAIDLADSMDGDPEAEAATWPNDIHARHEAGMPDDYESTGDEEEAAWIEWTSMRGNQKSGANMTAGHEDDEEDDPAEEDDPSGQCDEDEINSHDMWLQLRGRDFGPGCTISDAGGDEHDGREHEQMPDDVPMLPVLSAEHNVFTDARVPLGLSNLQSSYRTNGAQVRSADTGSVHIKQGITGSRESRFDPERPALSECPGLTAGAFCVRARYP
jgi:hypothetical protein